MANPFPPELRTMAFVPRWCIVMTTFKDYVASHSYFVAVYSYMIAEVIRWEGPRHYLMLNALMHDTDETVTGDITGPVKPHIIDEEATINLVDALNEERLGGLQATYNRLEGSFNHKELSDVRKIVSAADKLDALLFLVVNKRAGNTMVDPAIDGGLRALDAAWRALPAPQLTLDSTWNTVVLPSIEEHYNKGGRGCAPGSRI